MNYKVDNEYIVKFIDHNSSHILFYWRPFYLLRTSFARGKKPGFPPPGQVFELARPLFPLHDLAIDLEPYATF